MLISNIINLSSMGATNKFSNEISGKVETECEKSMSKKNNKEKKFHTQKDEVVRIFISQFVGILIREIKQKFPNSFRIHSLSIYYHMYVFNKPHRGITELRGFDLFNPSMFEKIL